MISKEILDKLRPWQQQPANALLEQLSRNQAAVDLSDCGVGKTYTACGVLAAMQIAALVVCPKITVSQWHAAAAHFGDTVSVIGYEALRAGGSPFGGWDHPPERRSDREYFQCQTCQLKVDFEDYQPCYTHPAGIHCIVRKTIGWNYGRFNYHPAVRTIVFDEVQRCAGQDSLNAELLIAAKREGRKILGLSATLASTPLQLRAIGYALDLFKHPRDFPRWAAKYGVRFDPLFHGLKWFAGADKQLEIMRDIRNSIIPSRGVRITKESIPGFPEVDITAELYDIDAHNEINQIYKQMDDSLRRLEQRQQADIETPLTIQLRACQRAELLKIPIATELALDLLAKGISVGIFVNFRETMTELRARLKCDCFIDGSPEGVCYRQRSIDNFQSGNSRLILVNSAAGGVGLSLPDLSGDRPRGGLVFPGYSAEKLKQVFGRFPRESSKSKSFYRVLLAAKTNDEKICKALRAKLNCLDALNDSDLSPSNLSFSEDRR